jgi:hypothetical protein
MTITEKERRWKREKEILIREQALREDKAKYRRRVPTSKLLAVFLIVNFMLVELYAMFAMIYLKDLSALYVLISSVVGEVMTYLIYVKKSNNDNSQGGIVYEMAMRDKVQGDER